MFFGGPLWILSLSTRFHSGRRDRDTDRISSWLLVVALGVGLASPFFKALTTKIQEMTLTFVPKIAAIFVTLAISIPLISCSHLSVCLTGFLTLWPTKGGFRVRLSASFLLAVLLRLSAQADKAGWVGVYTGGPYQPVETCGTKRRTKPMRFCVEEKLAGEQAL